MRLCALNCGSTSVKMTLFDETLTPIEAAVHPFNEPFEIPEADLYGHRIVHGGPTFYRPQLIDEMVLLELEGCRLLAPLHIPKELDLIHRLFQKKCPQVVTFDTAFFHDLPKESKRYALPSKYYDLGIRRYGFHGLSCEYCLSTFKGNPPEKLIIAHLGGGCSLTAIHKGRPIDTTMGLTPAGGVIMGTRLGDIDPGVLIHLMRHEHLSLDQLERLVNCEAGLKALSGQTGDMATLLKETTSKSREAIAQFVRAIVKAIGSFAALMGGVDLVVFTGGIGEHCPEITNDVAARCAFLNAQFKVIETDEDLMIAKHTLEVAR